MDRPQPVLSWRLESDRRSVNQTAFRILVASSADILAKDEGDLWDSGKIEGARTIRIRYGGKPLQSAQKVFWKIRSWINGDHPTSWSRDASWTMGLLLPADWGGAQWISGPIRKDWKQPKKKTGLTGLMAAETPPRDPGVGSATDSVLLRKEFQVSDKIRRATLFVCGLGQYEAFLNGKPVTETFLNPGWTRYDKTCLYNAYDVTGLIGEGGNCLAAMLGNSFYNIHDVPEGRYCKRGFNLSFQAPRMIAILILEHEDGSVSRVVTDSSWLAAPGPITLSHIYAGEDYDARLLPAGWDSPCVPAQGWVPATVLPASGAVLNGLLRGLSASAPPIRFFETFTPVSSKTNAPGITTYDFGQNAAVVVRMKVKGPAGSVVRVEPSELVYPDGRIDPRNIRGGSRAYWQYTLRGGAEETYQGNFFYQGARYFQVELIPPPGSSTLPELLSLEARVIQADSPAVGTFECSNPLFNRIWQLIRWAQRSNMVSYMTDCPTREKLGWLEEDHLNGPALHANWDMSRSLGKVLHDMSDAQGPDGFVPTTAPTYAHFGGAFQDSPEWGSSAVIVLWQMYQIYGDPEVLREHYPMMKACTDYLQHKATGNILNYGLGDWYDIGPGRPGVSQLTQREITATGYLFEDTAIVAEAARILGNTTDAAAYTARAAQIRKDFNAALFNSAKGVYGTSAKYPAGSQCANALPLVFGIVDPANVSTVTKSLVSDIISRGNTGGDVGYRYVLRAVADAGRSDIIYAMNNQSVKPGYGMMLQKGATALTEPWSGTGASQNHFMLGQLNEWLFHDLAGIQYDPASPGYAHFLISPAITGDLTWVKCSYDSVRGKIVSDWSLKDGKLTMKVTVPPDTTATIRVPTTAPDQVTESGVPVPKAEGIKVLRKESGALLLEAGSGTYELTAPFSKS